MVRPLLFGLVAFGAGAYVACGNGGTLKAPTSDTQYDDGEGNGTDPGLAKHDAAPMNPADAGGARPVALPNGSGGVGFDDFRFSAKLGKVIVPAGRSGNLDLVDPATLAVTNIGGFSTLSGFDGTHTDGTTSADEGNGVLFAIDRTSKRLDVVDPSKGMIVSSALLGGAPDYVRYVAPTNEVWVTEDVGIEIFSLDAQNVPTHAAVIATPSGAPEALEIDATAKRAYTHIAAGTTASIDVMARTIAEQWPNGCTAARGIAVDAAKGFVFVGCSEGKVVALDAAHGGAQLGSAGTAQGVDAIAYDGGRGRLYVPGTQSEALTVVAVDGSGKLTALGTVPVVAGAHCVATDGNANAYLCDPADGEVVVLHDAF